MDGSKAVYDGWEEDEPDHTRGNEHCAIMDDEEVWDDKPCQWNYTYTCSFGLFWTFWKHPCSFVCQM